MSKLGLRAAILASVVVLGTVVAGCGNSQQLDDALASNQELQTEVSELRTEVSVLQDQLFLATSTTVAQGPHDLLTLAEGVLSQAHFERIPGHASFWCVPDTPSCNTRHTVKNEYSSFFEMEGDEDYLSLSLRECEKSVIIGDWRVSCFDTLATLLDELGFPGSMMDRIGNTRALDGTLTAETDFLSAYWTYHPDDGLNVVIERSN